MDAFLDFLFNFVLRNYLDIASFVIPILFFALIFLIRKNLIHFVLYILKNYLYTAAFEHVHSKMILISFEIMVVGSAIYPLFLATRMSWVYNVFYTLIVIGSTIGISESINFAFDLFKKKSDLWQHAESVNLSNFTKKMIKLGIYLIAFLLIINNIYDEFTFAPLFTYFGLLSAAISFAARDYISNFFGSVAILMGHPCSIGDRIIVENTEGIVEAFGFQQTQLRVKDQSIVYVPNKNIITSNVINKSRTVYRAINFDFQLDASASSVEIKKITQDIRMWLTNHKLTAKHFKPRVFISDLSNGNFKISVYALIAKTEDPALTKEEILIETRNILKKYKQKLIT